MSFKGEVDLSPTRTEVYHSRLSSKFSKRGFACVRNFSVSGFKFGTDGFTGRHSDTYLTVYGDSEARSDILPIQHPLDRTPTLVNLPRNVGVGRDPSPTVPESTRVSFRVLYTCEL